MKLGFRDFYYLDTDYVDNLLGYIEGFIEEEVSSSENEEQLLQGKAKAMGFGEAGKHSTKGKEYIRKGKSSPEIKFKRVIDFLIKNELDQINTFDEELWKMLIQEEELIEVRGSLHFTKIYDLMKSTSYMGKIGSELGIIENHEVEKTTAMINKLRGIQEKNGIPVILRTRDDVYSFVAYLNERYMMKEQMNIVGNDFKMLCKIERVVPKRDKVNLLDLSEIQEKFENREQRRNKQKSKLPKEFDESIKGPTAIVLPIAIYR